MHFNFTLGKRIAVGIVLMLMIMVVVGMTGYRGIGKVSNTVNLYEEINSLTEITASSKEQVDQYMLAVFRTDPDAQKAAYQNVLATLEQGNKALAKIQQNFALNAEERQKLASAGTLFMKYRQLFIAYVKDELTRGKMQGVCEQHYTDIEAEIGKGQLFVEEMLLAIKVLKSDMIGYFNHPIAAFWDKVQQSQATFLKNYEDWFKKVSNSDQLRVVADNIRAKYDLLAAALESYNKTVTAQEAQRTQMEEIKKQLYSLSADLTAFGKNMMYSQSRTSNTTILCVILAALLIGVAYTILSIRLIVGKMNGVIKGITKGADQVTEASTQVARSSQSQAEGASQQAASLEETSSSLEEISSMVIQNAKNAEEARSIMDEVQNIVQKVNSHMGDMSKAIEKITISSSETDKIVKTIDEIAFQTNLLALNAAVEAARAGEAGAGFAVVADEVRNLAMRAAEAAKNTASLIGDTIQAVREGNRLTEETQQAFQENVEISAKVGSLVEEIASASKEQSEGIQQVTKAVNEMDKVTQENAAGAEESASASEELTTQAESMKGWVHQMQVLIHGSRTKKTQSRKEKKGAGTVRLPVHEVSLTADRRVEKADPHSSRSAPARFPEMDPKKVIPLDDQDFEDF